MNLPVNLYDNIMQNSASRVFIFAEARSGSTWLLETLNSCSELFLLKEIMQPGQRQEFSNRYPEYFNSVEGDVLYIEKQLSLVDGIQKGCKILFPQAVRFMDIYEFLFNYRDAKFILLRRENVLKGEVSGFVARQFALWHPTEHTERHMVEIDPELLYKRILWRNLSTTFCINLIKAHCNNFLEITYEELFPVTSRVIDSLCDFLTISNRSLSPAREVKSNPHSLDEIIINYDAVKAYFKDKGSLSLLLD
jgi:LPS sulfotransferase NodH